MEINGVIKFLQNYDKPLKIMEVCGSHTSAIIKSGIRSLISPSIRLVSGPGCPVCVTPPSYIDSLADYAHRPDNTVLSFGDMFKVRGSAGSLAAVKANGASVEMMYSPLEAIPLARENPSVTFVVAAVGFETTAPVFAVLTEHALAEGLKNIRLITALKTMPPALDYICRSESVDAFLCPGHVSAIIGAEAYRKVAEDYGKPCAIAGFEPEHILAAIYEIAVQHETGRSEVKNLYKSVVTGRPQPKATALMEKYFVPENAYWRGIGEIADSGLVLRPEYSQLDLSVSQSGADDFEAGCRCRDVMLGRIDPPECWLFGRGCTPENAVGACMVSAEGACGNWFNGAEK
jgi:hydrogenase expression/formation protein HypD